MNKDEILEKSREENENQDEMEKQVFARAGQAACAVGGLVCVLLIFVEVVATGNASLSSWAVYLSMTGTTLLVKYGRLKKKHELIFGLVQIGLAVTYFVLYVVRLVGQ